MTEFSVEIFRMLHENDSTEHSFYIYSTKLLSSNHVPRFLVSTK